MPEPAFAQIGFDEFASIDRGNGTLFDPLDQGIPPGARDFRQAKTGGNLFAVTPLCLIPPAVAGKVPGKGFGLLAKIAQDRRRWLFASFQQTAKIAQATELQRESEPIARTTMAHHPSQIIVIQRAKTDNPVFCLRKTEQALFVLLCQQRHGCRRGHRSPLGSSCGRALSSNGTENSHKLAYRSSIPAVLGSRSGLSSPRAMISGRVKA